MPYKSKKDLPKQVKNNLPEHAQEIYQEVYENAQEYYKTRSRRDDPNEPLDRVAAKVAWSAIKKKYKKSGDRWVRK